VVTEGVDYVGPIAQTMLAAELSRCAALAYPCTFMETSCIAALEAMAAGLTVLTTRTAALPETTAGFASFVEYRADRAKLAEDFAVMAIDALKAQPLDPANARAKRDGQIAYVREHYVWPKRALEWQGWLHEIVRRHAA
jgi:glycosyltransferase involved in cell wall biosynthesis